MKGKKQPGKNLLLTPDNPRPKYVNGSSLDNPYELCNRINVFLSKSSLKNLLIQHKSPEKKTLDLKGLYSKWHSMKAYLDMYYF